MLSKIRPILGEEFDIDRVYIGVGNLHFYGVSVPIPDQNIMLKIKDLRVGYNIAKLLLYRGFDPKIVTQDILIINPKICFQLRSGEGAQKSADPPQRPGLQVDGFIRQLSFLDRVSVKNGELVLQVDDRKEIRLATHVDGWLDKDAADSLHIQLAGRVMSGDVQNLSVRGQACTTSGVISSLDARIQNFQLSLLNTVSDSLAVRFIDGRLDGEIKLSSPVDSTGNVRYTGFFDVRDGSAALPVDSLFVEDANIRFLMNDSSLHVQEATYLLNDNTFTTNGSLSWHQSPAIDLSLLGQDVQLSDFKGVIDKKAKTGLSGLASVRVRANGPLSDMTLTGRIQANECRFGKTGITDLSVDVLYRSNILDIRKGRVHMGGLDISLTGQADFNKPEIPLNGSMTAKGDWAKVLDPVTVFFVSSAPMWLEAEIGGTFKEPILFGNCGLEVFSAPREILSTTAAISFSNNIIRARSSNNPGNRRFQVVADFSQAVPYFHVNIDHFEDYITNFIQYPGKRYFQDNFALFIEAQGTRRDLDLDTYVKYIEGGTVKKDVLAVRSALEIDAGVTSSFGHITLHPGAEYEKQGHFSLVKDENGLMIKNFNLGKEINAFYRSDYASQALSGSFTLSELSLARLFLTPDSILTGELDLDIELDGLSTSPKLTCHAQVRELFIHDLGPYTSRVSMTYQDEILYLHNLLLNSKEATLVYARGEYDVPSDSMQFTLKGAGFDAGAFSTVRNRVNPPVSGRTLVDVQITGTSKLPRLEGTVAIKEGKILLFPFDELEVVLGPPASTVKTGTAQFNFKSFRLTRQDVFQLSGSGSLPFASQDSLHFDCEGQGNFLALLPDADRFFKNPVSRGQLVAKLSGTRVQPVLESLKLNFDRAGLAFQDVVPPVTDLAGDIEFEPDDLFIHVKKLEGKMGGKAFRIYTVPAEEAVCARPLQNMQLGPSGMNIGVLVLESPEQGVPLSFTGLMEPGVYGRLNLIGREEGEKFYLAGPADRPLLRGGIDLYNVEFMYPFYQTNRKPSPNVKKFLESIEWDLLVRPVKDVRYVKTFPGAIDKAYVNLQLDEKFGGLAFTGQIADESWRINGVVRSTAGFIEYLDMNFRIERAGAEFDKSSLIPVVYGQAKTTVTDSMGMPTEITLTLQTVDETMDQKSVDDIVRQEQGRARWDEIRFKLSSNSPYLGDSEAQIMASLGYSTETLQNKAFDAIGFSTENFLFRPIFRPVERKIESVFGLDYVRFSSRFAKNLIDFNLNNNYELNSRLSLLRSTKVILGKYLADRFFLQYTGQVEAGIDYRYREKSVGLHHTVGLEYRVNPQLLLELEYDYDSLMLYNREDKRILLRHWFPF